MDSISNRVSTRSTTVPNSLHLLQHNPEPIGSCLHQGFCFKGGSPLHFLFQRWFSKVVFCFKGGFQRWFSVSKVVLVSIFQITIFQVTRGWGQVIKLDGSLYSIDPDEPGDKNFNYTWFCRRSPLIGFSNKFYLVRTDGGGEKLDNGLEGPEMFKEYYTIDSDGDGTDEEYPVYKNYEAQRIPKTRDPMIINPLPGCFGYGPGPVKVKGPRLTLNTSSFVTYAQVRTHQSCCSTHQ